MKFADDLARPLFHAHGHDAMTHERLRAFPRQLHRDVGPYALGALISSDRAVNLTYGLDAALAAHPEHAPHVILDRAHIELLSHFPYAQRIDYVEKRSATLPEELMSWAGLRVLSLKHNKKIKSLHKHFALATNLEALDLDGLWNLSDLSRLTSIPSLKYLSLDASSKLEDYSPIGDHTALRHVRIRHAAIDALIAPLSHASALHALELEYCCTQPEDVDMLVELLEARGDLEKLALPDLELDVRHVGKLPRGLIELDLKRPSHIERGLFAGLTSLRALDLSYYPERWFPDDIAELESLELLDLSMSDHLDEADFSPLASLQNLTHINLDHSPLTRIPDEFAELGRLAQLSLKPTHIVCLEDLSALRGLPALRELDVRSFTDQAHLQDIVMSLPALERLGVHRHIDIRPFAEHPSLEFITRVHEPYLPEEIDGLFEVSGATAFSRRG